MRMMLGFWTCASAMLQAQAKAAEASTELANMLRKCKLISRFLRCLSHQLGILARRGDPFARSVVAAAIDMRWAALLRGSENLPVGLPRIRV
jgi:hypothetical protein